MSAVIESELPRRRGITFFTPSERVHPTWDYGRQSSSLPLGREFKSKQQTIGDMGMGFLWMLHSQVLYEAAGGGPDRTTLGMTLRRGKPVIEYAYKLAQDPNLYVPNIWVIPPQGDRQDYSLACTMEDSIHQLTFSTTLCKLSLWDTGEHTVTGLNPNHRRGVWTSPLVPGSACDFFVPANPRYLSQLEFFFRPDFGVTPSPLERP